jgi:16S rRNA (guanine1207-N2)-methyltransferase
MSGASSSAPDLLGDQGVLWLQPTFEVGDYAAVSRVGGAAFLHWRAQVLRAQGITVVDALPEAIYAQAVVRVGKGRFATWADIGLAYAALKPGGQLLIHGHNEVGIVTWGKRVAQQLGQEIKIVSNRAHSRVYAFVKTSAEIPQTLPTKIPFHPDAAQQLLAYPGVFSHDALDAGTHLLMDGLTQLAAQISPPGCVVDLGCGAGHVGLWALRLFPDAQAILCDGDARAVRSARHNVEQLGFSERARLAWWDAFEQFPDIFPAHKTSAQKIVPDVVVINPPCHAGTALDYSVARQLFVVARQLCPHGRILVVANRQLPYEADLARLGSVTVSAEKQGFKLLSVV